MCNDDDNAHVKFFFPLPDTREITDELNMWQCVNRLKTDTYEDERTIKVMVNLIRLDRSHIGVLELVITSPRSN